MLIFNINFFLRNNYIFVGLTAMIFAYALSKRFNNEFKELVELKNALEEKVRERTRELLEAKEKIEKQSELKSNFFINLSHEIKTPLTLIDNYFNKHIEEIGESDAIKIVKSNINKLKKDIINIFDIEKINKGKVLYFHDKTINASLFIEKQLIMFKEIAEEKKIKISSSLADNIFIKIDPYALDRIINNLLDNAIKYTDENGEIKIILKKNNDNIEFVVEDNGCGIPDEFKEYIFDPYYQITSKKSNLQGIGMGLAIVKSIIDELNGEIYLESSVGKGTKITIKLNDNINYLDSEVIDSFNYYKPTAIDEKTIQINEEFMNSKKTILIVEDNIQMLNYLYSVLKTDLNIYYSKNGKEALQKLNWIPKPDIILSDIMMDEMDGYEFYDNIKNIENFKDIPFLFLTAKTEENEKIAGLTKGAIDYITKPFNIDELKAKINSILANRGLFKESNTIEFKNKLSNFLDKDENKNKIYETMLKYNINNIELKIIELLMDGAEYKEISDAVDVSLSSIKRRIHEIYKKLGIQNKIELIKLFKKNT